MDVDEGYCQILDLFLRYIHQQESSFGISTEILSHPSYKGFTISYLALVPGYMSERANSATGV